jgi:hypothetical protein
MWLIYLYFNAYHYSVQTHHQPVQNLTKADQTHARRHLSFPICGPHLFSRPLSYLRAQLHINNEKEPAQPGRAIWTK